MQAKIKSGPVQVGTAVAVIVTRHNKVLFGRRVIADGEFLWQLPGGWIESQESPPEAARREVLEETGLSLLNLTFVAVTNNIFSAQSHSISLYFEAECVDDDALNLSESDKCISWEWKDWAEVDNNLFPPLQLLRQTGYRPFLPDKSKTHVSF